ncbi:hypothetical protein HG442_002060 [Candidatus Gracilibacteria bacterium]|nr:hypothetical protein [Candidatus Gracilibacteria bacterium]
MKKIPKKKEPNGSKKITPPFPGCAMEGENHKSIPHLGTLKILVKYPQFSVVTIRVLEESKHDQG